MPSIVLENTVSTNHSGVEPDHDFGGVICSECGWSLTGPSPMAVGTHEEFDLCPNRHA